MQERRKRTDMLLNPLIFGFNDLSGKVNFRLNLISRNGYFFVINKIIHSVEIGEHTRIHDGFAKPADIPVYILINCIV